MVAKNGIAIDVQPQDVKRMVVEGCTLVDSVDETRKETKQKRKGKEK
jgi:hypothetical protein